MKISFQDWLNKHKTEECLDCDGEGCETCLDEGVFWDFEDELLDYDQMLAEYNDLQEASK